MRSDGRWAVCSVSLLALLAGAADARAQGQSTESRWVVDVGIGIDPSINGNINSGAIGTLQGQATAILPQPYGNVYGTGFEFHFGGGYMLDENAELRGIFTFQSADADLVQLGDIGPSPLYAQYTDYKSFGLDLGYRRYFLPSNHIIRPFGEILAGAAFVDRINVQFAAPRANLTFTQNDFYDATAAFTFSLNFGLLIKVRDQVDLTTQLGFRHVGQLSQVDQLVGTGLEKINDDTARLTFPIAVGVRYRFK